MSLPGPPSDSPAAELPSLARANWLAKPALVQVFAVIADGGEKARAVGGAVRNTLLGLPVEDIDLATTARPEQVMRLAAEAGLKAIPTGIEHGTVTVVAHGEAVEITTLRRDIETFGRHARVTFTTDWAEDAARRDFTINALYCDADGTLHDPLGGYADLVARRVRFIGDAHQRIREDYLRILRFFRFTATYGGAPDPEGLAAAAAERAGIAALSPERVRVELLRLLGAPRARPAIELMADTGILELVLGPRFDLATFAKLTEIERACGRTPDPLLRLASLAAHAPEDATRLQERLRLSAAETARLAAAAARTPPLSTAAGYEQRLALLYRLGRTTVVDRWLLAWARGEESALAGAPRIGLAHLTVAVPPVLPVRGADVLALGVPPGPRVGEVLAAFEAWWLAEGMPSDVAQARARLADFARSR